MSAHIVSDDTMRLALLGLERDDTAADLTALGRRLFTLNETAVNARYNEFGTYEGQDFVYYVVKSTKIEQYKALSCLIYQCHEGDVPESSLYKELERAQTRLARSIVEQTQEYKDAAWDRT